MLVLQIEFRTTEAVTLVRASYVTPVVHEPEPDSVGWLPHPGNDWFLDTARYELLAWMGARPTVGVDGEPWVIGLKSTRPASVDLSTYTATFAVTLTHKKYGGDMSTARMRALKPVLLVWVDGDRPDMEDLANATQEAPARQLEMADA